MDRPGMMEDTGEHTMDTGSFWFCVLLAPPNTLPQQEVPPAQIWYLYWHSPEVWA